MQIILNDNEVLVSGYVGMRRNAEALCRGRTPHFPEKFPGEMWTKHIEGAHAECAVARALGLYWGFTVNTFHKPDIVNTSLEVRWSTRRDVKVRPDDSGIIVSVSGLCPRYTINGWIMAEAAKRPEWRCDKPPPCYFVPLEELQPITELKRTLWGE